MNYIEQLHGSPRFVRLQVPDEMPTSGLAPDFGNLCLRFLNAILAEVGYPDRGRLLNDLSRMGLTDCYECDVTRLPICPERGLCYLLSDPLQTPVEFCLTLLF